jgi:D-galactarolactone isomerase
VTNRAAGNRRNVLAGGGAFAAALAGRGALAQDYPRSLGIERPLIIAPPGATDCHMHLFAHGYPVQTGGKVSKFIEHAALDDYLQIRARLGLSRNVLIQPSTYGADNALLIDSLKRLGNSARGVIVVVPGILQATLQSYADQGVRGIRFNLMQTGTTTIEMIEQLSARVAPLGWHCSFYISPLLLMDNIGLFQRLPAPIVLEHNAALSSIAPDNPAVSAVRGLMDRGNTWVKLTSALGNDAEREMRSENFVRIARMLYAVPDRIVWGSDWPHVGTSDTMVPDDAFNLDLLRAVLERDEDLDRVLTINPATLYGFPNLD